MRLKAFNLKKYAKYSDSQLVCMRMGAISLERALVDDDPAVKAARNNELMRGILGINTIINRKRYQSRER